MSIKLKNITLPRILAFLFALYPCLNDMYINGNFKINNLILVVLVITSMTGVLKKKIDMSLEEKILGIILVIFCSFKNSRKLQLVSLQYL